MNVNPALARLGFGASDRVVVIHADDIGMCSGTVTAYRDLHEFGLVSSGSVMTVCPWFPALARWWRDHPAADLGIHLTLTSEWDTYRWGPISTRDTDSGLIDAEGFFHRTREAVVRQADPVAVAREMRAQVRRALDSGLTPTHIDAHMYTALEPPFVNDYRTIAAGHGLPAFAWRDSSRQVPGLPAGSPRERVAADALMFDFCYCLRMQGEPEERVAYAKQLIGELPPGLSCVLIHPCRDGSELRAIAPDWRYRVADFEAFTSKDLRRFVQESGVHVIGYRELSATRPGIDHAVRT